MKRLTIYAILALTIGLAIGSAVGANANPPLPGSAEDPVVTKGYVDNYINTSLQELRQEIARLKTDVAKLEALAAQKGQKEQQVIKLVIGSTTAYIGEEAQTIDTAPYLEGSTTMLPFKFIGDALGAKVGWVNETKTVTFEQGSDLIELKIGSKKALVNGSEVQLEVPPLIKNNRTFVPLRFVSTNLGAKVEWVNQTKTIIITQ